MSAANRMRTVLRALRAPTSVRALARSRVATHVNAPARSFSAVANDGAKCVNVTVNNDGIAIIRLDAPGEKVC